MKVDGKEGRARQPDAPVQPTVCRGAYPRGTKDEAAIVYHASPSIYLYTLKDGSTRKVSTRDGADYRYPHCEATPK